MHSHRFMAFPVHPPPLVPPSLTASSLTAVLRSGRREFLPRPPVRARTQHTMRHSCVPPSEVGPAAVTRGSVHTVDPPAPHIGPELNVRRWFLLDVPPPPPPPCPGMPCSTNTSVRTVIFWNLFNWGPGVGTALIGYRTACLTNTPVRTVFFEDFVVRWTRGEGVPVVPDALVDPPPLPTVSGAVPLPHIPALQVKGEGFVPGLACEFGPGLTTATTIVSPFLLQCHAPAATSSTAGCRGEALEVALHAGTATANHVRLQRVATPNVLTLHPPRGYYSVAQNVTLRGYGFVASPHVTCRFYYTSEDGEVALSVGPGTVVSSTVMRCRQPALSLAHWSSAPLPARGYLAISVDGQVRAPGRAHVRCQPQAGALWTVGPTPGGGAGLLSTTRHRRGGGHTAPPPPFPQKIGPNVLPDVWPIKSFLSRL